MTSHIDGGMKNHPETEKENQPLTENNPDLKSASSVSSDVQMDSFATSPEGDSSSSAASHTANQVDTEQQDQKQTDSVVNVCNTVDADAMQEESASTKPPRFRLTLGQVALLLIVAVGGTYTATNAAITGRLPWQISSEQGVLTNSDFRQLGQTYQLLQENFFGEVKHTEVMSGALNGMAQSLGDPYTSYFVDEANEELRSATEGKFEGIGAQIQMQNNQIVVISPIKGSPAEKAGIQSGDILLKAGDQSLEGKSAEEAVKLLRGKAGTQVKATIKRGDKTQELTLTRAEIPIETVYGKLDDQQKEVGIIQVTSFAENTAKEFQETVTALRKQGAKKFVLDLRGNPGGLLTSAIDMATMFLNEGDTIVKVVDKNGNQQTYQAEKAAFKVSEPTTVLVNEGSASASEILSGALQQSAHKKVIGTQTYGKGTVQTVIPYDQDKDQQLKITTAHWLTPNGTWINKSGITPDKTVDLPDYASLLVIDTAKTYQLNDKGEDIANLQRILVALEVLDDANVNGTFDQTTKAAVEQFQNDHQIEATGVVNSQTASELTAALKQKIVANDTQLQQAVKTVVSE